MAKEKKIEIPVSSVIFLYNVLSRIQLDIQKSSARRRIFKLFNRTRDLFNEDKKEIVEKYCERDKAGKPVIKQEEYVIPKANRKSFHDEMDILQNQNAIYDILPSNEKDFETIRQIVKKEIDENAKAKEFNALQFEYLESLKEVYESLELK